MKFYAEVVAVTFVNDELSKGKSSSGKPASRQPKKPPCSGRTRVIPALLSASARLALEASFGQVQ
jgi:hypothetical protein